MICGTVYGHLHDVAYISISIGRIRPFSVCHLLSLSRIPSLSRFFARALLLARCGSEMGYYLIMALPLQPYISFSCCFV